MHYSIREDDVIQLQVFIEMKNELKRLTPKILKRIYALLWDTEALSRKARRDVFKKYHEGWLQHAIFDKKRKGRPSPLTPRANALIRDMFYNRNMSYKEIQEYFKSHGQDISVDALRKRCKRYDTHKIRW